MAKQTADFEIELESFVDDFKKAAWSQGEKALTQVGIDAQKNVAALVPVDTGLLRNSITYAISGKAPAKKSYKADSGGESGSYDGTVGSENELAVYIGSNVEYAASVEFDEKKRHESGQAHYLRDGINDHLDEYKEAMKKILDEGVTQTSIGKGIIKKI